MRRRAFIVGLSSALASFSAAAQQARRVWKLGILETTDPEQNRMNFDALRRGLRELGYLEGENLIIEYRSAAGDPGRFPELASDLMRIGVDAVVTRGTPAVRAARRASTTVPIIMASSGDPAYTGAVKSLARPEGNVTGLSSFSKELEFKRIELLKEIAPATKRVGVLYNVENPVLLPQWELLSASRSVHGLEAHLLDIRGPTDIERAFQSASRERIDALTIGIDAITQANRRLIAQLAAQYRIPAIYASREFVEDGGLLSYSVSYPDLYLRAAHFVDRVLKGTRPAELPVEQPQGSSWSST